MTEGKPTDTYSHMPAAAHMPTGRRARTQAVKARARELGFDACAVAEAGPADPDDKLGRWLSRGFQADMAWIARSRTVRQDLRERLPEARSVVVTARSYYSERPPAMPGSGRVARYAWGRDYHRVLHKPVRALAEFMDALDGGTSFVSIDSGPVLERTWAERAGLGWIGKNSLVLRRDLGSWFFLAVIVSTVELEPDPPLPDLCGSCTRCLDACPTGAIVEPRVVDAGRCISYHTIENRGAIPEALQPAFGDWVFGCDVCQEVCPWNRFAQAATEPDFAPRTGHANPDLAALTAMSREEFETEFAGTPLRRAKFEGIRRNAAIALKHQNSERNVGK